MNTEKRNTGCGAERTGSGAGRRGGNRSGQVIGGIALFLAMLAGGSAARAGNGGYFAAYNSHIEKGEKEIMVMADYTRPSKAAREEGEKSYFSQMLELEWAVTDKFATELMLEGFQEPGGPKRFTGFRWENRYRLFKDETALNPMLYMEYEHLSHLTRFKMETSGWVHAPYKEEEETGKPKDERIMETRLVLSHDFGPTNVAFNWLNETDLRNTKTDFGYLFGVMHKLGHGEHHHGASHEAGSGGGFRLAAVGVELWGALGDSRKLDLSPSRQQHYLSPIAMFHIGSDVMFHISPTIGLSKVSDNLLRVAVGFEL